MFSPVWIATAAGLAAGVLIALALGAVALPRLMARAGNAWLLVRFAFAGAIAALLPALFLSLVVGGTLGSIWGAYLSRQLGLGVSGVPFGLAIGIALAFACVVLLGGALGIGTAGIVLHYRLRRERGTAPSAPHRRRG